MKDIPKGFVCETCLMYHDFPLYVYAHADIELRHECKVCGAVHLILAFQAEQVTPGKLPEGETA